MRTYRLWPAVIISIVVCVGCEEYVIDMRPAGNTIERKITCPSRLSEEARKTLMKVYEKQIDANTFIGTFGSSLPNDVGGAGFYASLVTDMGSTATYFERFRGDDDLNRTVESWQDMTDRYVDFTIEWLKSELGDEPNFANLRNFLDQSVRVDAKNIGLYLWLAVEAGVNEGADANQNEMVMRSIHYILERGYVKAEELPVVTRREYYQDEELIRLARRIVAEKMGYSDCNKAGEKLGFLADEDSIHTSLVKYIKSTERFKQMAAEREGPQLHERDANAQSSDVDIHKFISGGVELEYEYDIFGGTCKVEVTLACGSKPIETNGQWDEPNGSVHWSAYVKGKGRLPTFYYARWSEPNENFQSRHFGRIILDGKNLAEYCCWEKSIEAGQARRWNEFISGIDPNMEIGPIVAFRFSGESAEPNAPSLADVPRTLILNALSQH